jgi:hypothetical protein
MHNTTNKTKPAKSSPGIFGQPQSFVFWGNSLPGPIISTRSGFSKEAEAYCREKGIACSEDENWLGS